VLRGGSGDSATAALEASIKRLTVLARDKGVPVHILSRRDIRQALAQFGSTSRYAIAGAIAKGIPAFAPLLPTPRKIWNGEDRKMGLFDAAGLALTFFERKASTWL
jgi:hypothetical protein